MVKSIYTIEEVKFTLAYNLLRQVFDITCSVTPYFD